MWQLLHNIIAGALCLYILFLTSSLMSQKQARSATNEAEVMTFACDFDNCTFEANSASSFKRHIVSHSARDFPGCFYETVHISNLKRHSLTHSQAEKEVLHCDFPGCSFETVHVSSLKRHSLTHSQEEEILHCDLPGCSFETVRVSNLKRHSLTHSQAEKEEDERGQSLFFRRSSFLPW